MRQFWYLFVVVLTLPTVACNSRGLEQAIAPDPRLTQAANQNTNSPTPKQSPRSDTQPQISPSPSPKPGLGGYTDLDETPQLLRPYLDDLLRLQQLPLESCDRNPCSTFKPNQIIQRREFARWLLAANNRFYKKVATQLIRPANVSATPSFTDVPKSDPDFSAIQGLAEAGLIPSPLSNDKTAKAFQPAAPLTRTDLLLWKVPIDYRTIPPKADRAKVQDITSFQDLAKASQPLLNALLADHKNGDKANFRRAFGYITIFQPQRQVTRAEAAAVLWSFGTQSDAISAMQLLKPASKPTPAASPSPSPASASPKAP